MRQTELDKLVGSAVRALCRKVDWKNIGGILYRESGPLFFVLVIGASARERVLHWSLRVKWTEMDSELWRVLGLDSNLNGPTSLRANGAFTLTGIELAWRRVEECTWTEQSVQQLVEAILNSVATPVAEIAARIRSLDDFMQFAGEWHAELLARAPRAAVTIWKERVLFHLLKAEREAALDIAAGRIKAGDAGGFTVEGKTFFEKAERYAAIPRA